MHSVPLSLKQTYNKEGIAINKRPKARHTIFENLVRKQDASGGQTGPYYVKYANSLGHFIS